MIAKLEKTPWADPGGGGAGSGLPLKNHKSIWFLSNTGPDPLKNYKAEQASIQCWAIIGPPAKRHLNGVLLARFAGGPMMAHL